MKSKKTGKRYARKQKRKLLLTSAMSARLGKIGRQKIRGNPCVDWW